MRAAVLRKQTCSLQYSVALSQVSPSHMLIGDLNDISCGEPAPLTIRQAAAFIPPCEKEEVGEEKDEEGEQWRQLTVLVSFMQENQIISRNCNGERLRIDTVIRCRCINKWNEGKGLTIQSHISKCDLFFVSTTFYTLSSC